MTTSIDGNFWLNRAQEHFVRLNKEDDATAIALTVLKAAAIAFAAIGIAMPFAFGASLAIPAAKVILGAVTIGIICVIVTAIGKSGAKSLADVEKNIFSEQSASLTIHQRLLLLRKERSPITAEDAIRIVYGTNIEDFTLEQLSNFITKENLSVFTDETLKSLRAAIVNCDAGLVQKAKLCNKLNFSPADFEKLMKDTASIELTKPYPEFIKKNGTNAYNLLTQESQENYKKLVRWQHNDGKENHKMGWSWIQDLHRAELKLYGNELLPYRQFVQADLEKVFKTLEQTTSLDRKRVLVAKISLYLASLTGTGIIDQEWPFSERISDHFAANYYLYEEQLGPIASHPFYLSLKSKGLLSQAQIELAERGTKI